MSIDAPSDPDSISISFPCLRARQPVGDIFVAIIPYKRLISITYFDVRRVLQEERDFERYLGIQRPLDRNRVEQLTKYAHFADASFPTSVIIALEQDYVSYNSESREMTVSNFREGETTPSTSIRQLARVLDGQHRIAGLFGFDGSDFDLSVTIFVGADIADQAQIFATVNLEQTKVNRSLVYDLYELSRTRSPQKTCHNITVALDRDKESPLHKRIKRLGIATEGRVFEPVTQSTFVEGLLPYISGDPKGDRDTLLRGHRLLRANEEELVARPFRNLFVDAKDIEITQIVYNYFFAVRERWPTAWNERRRGYMLNRTNGVKALLRFLRVAYLNTSKPGTVTTRERFLSLLQTIQVTDEQFNIENFSPGTSGEARLFSVLRGRESL